MPFFDDRGFYKRAQIAANDLHLAGVVDFPDIDRLTIFADNLVPHVLRLDGVLRYSDELAAARSTPGSELPAGRRASSASCAPAPCTPASGSRGEPACPPRRSTTGSGTAASTRPTASGPRTSRAPSTTDGRLRGHRRRPRVPDVHRHRARGDGEPLGCLVGFTTQASIDPPRFIACLSHKNRTFRAAATRDARRARRARRRRRPRELFGGETGGRDGQVRAHAVARRARGRADPRPLRELVRRPRARALSTPATTTRSCSSRSPARQATRTSSRSTAPSGSIPATRPERSPSDV